MKIVVQPLKPNSRKQPSSKCMSRQTTPIKIRKKIRFYFSLQTQSKRDILLITGDFNAKVGYENIGPHGIGVMNENGELFAHFSAVNTLIIGVTFFPHTP
jgi:hypothetical protein